MKLPNANKPLTYFIVLLTGITLLTVLSSSGYNHPPITGTWKYVKILRNDSVFIPIGPNDSMVLNIDSTFRYDIAFKRSPITGTWIFVSTPEPKLNGIQGVLELKYENVILRTQPANTRHFTVTKLTDSSLVFTENGVFFEFIKQRN